MIIESDTRQQKDEHILKVFEEAGIKYIRNKLYAGDYKRVDSTKVIIDTKKDLNEIAGNLCRTTEHNRLKREIANACGYWFACDLCDGSDLPCACAKAMLEFFEKIGKEVDFKNTSEQYFDELLRWDNANTTN